MIKENEAEMLKKRFNLSQEGIAEALASDYVCILFVNKNSGQYIEYSSSELYRSLHIPMAGDDFFSLVEKTLFDLLYVEDRDIVLTALTKKNVSRVLKIDKSFTISFRVVVDNKPVYIELKITNMINDNEHIVAGFRNIDAHMKRIEEYENNKKTHLTFAGIAEALAADYVCLFYVNTKNDKYKEFYSSEKYKEYGIPPEGEMLFSSIDGLGKHIYKEDLKIFKTACTKENILRVLSLDKSFILTIRFMVDNLPCYYRLKITRMMLEDEYHVVVGISNIDDQMKREESYAKSLSEVKEIAYKDSLTNVKSKHAYSDIELKYNEEIKNNKRKDFALLVCDVNNLKTINDTKGHKVGDKYIQDCALLICKIYKHSPVFRVGGDEFVVILEDNDYKNRARLLDEINKIIDEKHLKGEESISIGMSDFEKGIDNNFHEIFERADKKMYIRKKELKSRKN